MTQLLCRGEALLRANRRLRATCLFLVVVVLWQAMGDVLWTN